MILGIDEVGRGPWAGPLVVGAVILDTTIDGLTDSKKLSKKRRETLYSTILEQAAAVGLGWVQADEIDKVGLSEALYLATRRAVRQIQDQHVTFHEVIIDGTINLLKGTSLEQYVTTLKKADLLVPSVSAASIVAKVARDAYMASMHEEYPEYGFNAHVGYGTAQHKLALEKFGKTPLHRNSFSPIASIAKTSQGSTASTEPNTTTETGTEAESAASRWLERQGYTIVERNWKIKLCEIDIVAEKQDRLYFVEVKHRKTAKSGDGLAAITAKKLRQMRFAADMYVHWHNLYSTARVLAVISTSGESLQIDQCLEID